LQKEIVRGATQKKGTNEQKKEAKNRKGGRLRSFGEIQLNLEKERSSKKRGATQPTKQRKASPQEKFPPKRGTHVREEIKGKPDHVHSQLKKRKSRRILEKGQTPKKGFNKTP